MREQADEKWMADTQANKREEGNAVDDRNKKSLGEKNEKFFRDLPPDAVVLTHQEIRVIGQFLLNSLVGLYQCIS